MVPAIAAIAAAGPVEAWPVFCGHPSWRLLAALASSALGHIGATFGWVAVVTGGEGGDGAVGGDLVDSQRHGWVWVGAGRGRACERPWHTPRVHVHWAAPRPQRARARDPRPASSSHRSARICPRPPHRRPARSAERRSATRRALAVATGPTTCVATACRWQSSGDGAGAGGGKKLAAARGGGAAQSGEGWRRGG